MFLEVHFERCFPGRGEEEEGGGREGEREGGRERQRGRERGWILSVIEQLLCCMILATYSVSDPLSSA